MNPHAVALIKEFEGLHLSPYLCPAGVPTIGWGTTISPRGPVTLQDSPITPLEADLLLARDVATTELGVWRHVRIPLSPKSMGALISFAYNLGVGALARSTLLRRVNAQEWEDVPRQFFRWRMAQGRILPGLVRRREAEARLFMDGLDG